MDILFKMKPYGREKKLHHFKGKIDYHPHPKRKLQNWWESICDCLSRSTMKRKWKKENEL